MGTMTLVVGLVLLALFLLAALLIVVSRRKEDQQSKDLLAEESRDLRTEVEALRETVQDVSAEVRYQTRYEVRLADWGPDFTGEDGTLPRWRWVVLDADREVKALLGTTPETGTEAAPFMLGNAPTPLAAMAQAMRWIEAQGVPQMRVVIDEHGLAHGERA